jgi:hypothetical protein
MLFTFPKFTLDVDIEKTKKYYETAGLGSENCNCGGCRNYEKAIALLPEDVLSFFSQLGIDMKKIREVCVYCANADDTLFYGGFYHACGKLVKGESAWVSDNPNLKHWEEDKAYSITKDFRVSCQNNCDLLDDNFPLPAVQLDISADIPWVLAEQHDYPKDTERRKLY